MRNIVLRLMFDGSAYHGFQRQKNGVTIQEKLEDAVFAITGGRTPVLGCSRTDAGVHARSYVAMFASEVGIPMPQLPKALNSALPDDIRVMQAKVAPEGFHPIFSAKEKTYEYTIINRRVNDVFRRKYAWFYPILLDVERMRRAASWFIGEHDFATFMAAGGTAKTSVRHITGLDIEEKDGLIRIRITANGFLYNMVRIITGTLVYVGNGKLESDDIPDIIRACDRRRAGMTAPPEGLMLLSTVYPDFTFEEK
ncbi:MAG: tRNA pseudouridine(38-40) synthase TruA [Clostridia bacterium]|nr:tRNA pseudouridine(38-40) synthase TruA [Oscillospiraceae bacterium]MBQ7033927.1 tRNA pseudouridine(38-40) synthase TruA [Clostridia bacterium]